MLKSPNLFLQHYFLKIFSTACSCFSYKVVTIFFPPVLISPVSDELGALTRFHTQSNEGCSSPHKLQETQLSRLLCNTAVTDRQIMFRPAVTQPKLSAITSCLCWLPEHILRILQLAPHSCVREHQTDLTNSGMFSRDASGHIESSEHTALRWEVALFTSRSLGARSLHQHAPLGLRPRYVSFLGGLAEALG